MSTYISESSCSLPLGLASKQSQTFLLIDPSVGTSPSYSYMPTSGIRGLMNYLYYSIFSGNWSFNRIIDTETVTLTLFWEQRQHFCWERDHLTTDFSTLEVQSWCYTLDFSYNPQRYTFHSSSPFCTHCCRFSFCYGFLLERTVLASTTLFLWFWVIL